ncbi:MAG: helix-turn-helix domain-containing protein [Myxococcales bacterium]|nr:helix-turn-helix domain-containing protein [Myxococcales bacterium]
MERTMTMTEKELSRLHVLRAIHERRLTQAAAARELGLSTRHLRRLVRSYEGERISTTCEVSRASSIS